MKRSRTIQKHEESPRKEPHQRTFSPSSSSYNPSPTKGPTIESAKVPNETPQPSVSSSSSSGSLRVTTNVRSTNKRDRFRSKSKIGRRRGMKDQSTEKLGRGDDRTNQSFQQRSTSSTAGMNGFIYPRVKSGVSESSDNVNLAHDVGSRRKTKVGKRYPGTPPSTVFEQSYSRRPSTTLSSGTVKKDVDEPEVSDVGLVDYEDYGDNSSSYSSNDEGSGDSVSYSSYSDTKNPNDDKVDPHPPRNQQTEQSHLPRKVKPLKWSSTLQRRREYSSNLYYSFDDGDGAGRTVTDVDTTTESAMYPANDIDYVDYYDEMAPCSSSSMRDRYSSGTHGSASHSNAASKTSRVSDLQMVPVYEDTFEIYTTSNNDSVLGGSEAVSRVNSKIVYGEQISEKDEEGIREDRGESIGLSESGGGGGANEGEGENGDDDTSCDDKYLHSGVGRHYGKKKESIGNIDGNSMMSDLDGEGGNKGSCIGEKFYGWMLRLKAVSMVFFGTLFVLSLFSLLFIFPLVVDPILWGLEAEFSTEKVTCRTTKFRQAKGPNDCSVPSCRAGCTADLYLCYFIDVQYEKENDSSHVSSNTSNLPLTNNSELLEYNTSSLSESDGGNKSVMGVIELNTNSSKMMIKQATLYVNINGCGYPPDVNCTEFELKYKKVGTEFQCHFSIKNDSLVVPEYNPEKEQFKLLLSILIPVTLSAFSASALFVLIKCVHCKSGRIMALSSSDIQLIDDPDLMKKKKKGKATSQNDEEFGASTRRFSSLKGMKGIKSTSLDGVDAEAPYMNGYIHSKMNGHALQDTISGLMGMKTPSQIQSDIKKLPHQHDSIDKSMPYLNGSPQPQQQQRRPRYVKKNEVKANSKQPLSVHIPFLFEMPSTSSPKDKDKDTNGGDNAKKKKNP